jgi:nucleotide-binding universal stress UspA family protein
MANETSVELPAFRMMAAVDRSDAAAQVVARAVDSATHASKVEFLLVHVVERGGLFRKSPVSDEDLAEVDAWLVGLLNEALGAFDELDTSEWRMTIAVHAGNPKEEVLFLADNFDADLVVVGRPRLSGKTTTSGLGHSLLEQAPCPILVVRDKEPRVHEDEAPPANAGNQLSTSSWLVPRGGLPLRGVY